MAPSTSFCDEEQALKNKTRERNERLTVGLVVFSFLPFPLLFLVVVVFERKRNVVIKRDCGRVCDPIQRRSGHCTEECRDDAGRRCSRSEHHARCGRASVCVSCFFLFSHLSHTQTLSSSLLNPPPKNIQTSGEIKRQRDAIIARLQSVNETLLLLQQKLAEQEQQKQQEEEDESSSGSDSGSESGSESESDGELPDTDSAEAVARTLALVHEAEQLLREQESRGRSASPVPPRARGRANSLRSLFTNPPPRPDTGSSTPGSPTPRKAPSPSPTARH